MTSTSKVYRYAAMSFGVLGVALIARKLLTRLVKRWQEVQAKVGGGGGRKGGRGRRGRRADEQTAGHCGSNTRLELLETHTRLQGSGGACIWGRGGEQSALLCCGLESRRSARAWAVTGAEQQLFHCQSLQQSNNCSTISHWGRATAVPLAITGAEQQLFHYRSLGQSNSYRSLEQSNTVPLAFRDVTTPEGSAAKSESLQRAPLTRPRP
eukprot:64213-Chlamydomonas_euryale.AAC.1